MHIHFLLKFKDPKFDGETFNTIEEHCLILKKEGVVHVGKIGKKVGLNNLHSLNDQIKSNTPTYLFLVSNKSQGFKVFKCLLNSVSDMKPTAAKHPNYYTFLSDFSVWFEVTKIEEVHNKILTELITISTQKSALESISKGMASMLFVEPKVK